MGRAHSSFGKVGLGRLVSGSEIFVLSMTKTLHGLGGVTQAVGREEQRLGTFEEKEVIMLGRNKVFVPVTRVLKLEVKN